MKGLFIFFLIIFLACQGSIASLTVNTITSATSGNWTTTTTWVGGAVPTSADNVVIAANHTVTVTEASFCKAITFGTNAKLSMTQFNLLKIGQ